MNRKVMKTVTAGFTVMLITVGLSFTVFAHNLTAEQKDGTTVQFAYSDGTVVKEGTKFFLLDENGERIAKGKVGEDGMFDYGEYIGIAASLELNDGDGHAVTFEIPASALITEEAPQTTDDSTGEKENTGSSAAYISAEGSVVLKATGVVTYKFEEAQEEDWADGVEAMYIREMPEDISEPLSEEDLVEDDMKYTVSTDSVIIDSDLFPVEPSSEVTYDVVMQAEGYDDYHLALTVQNYRPTDFTIRTIDGEGNVVTEKVFSYEEMEAMCTEEVFSSAACPMHGLNSYHGIGVKLADLFAAAGVEFTEGMSLAARSVDAPATVEATEINNGNKTGYVFENPEKYWVKARYTDNYRITYEDLFGRERYFLYPWDDEEVSAMLTEDGSAWSIEARKALAESGLYEPVDAYLCIQYDSIQWSSDTSDIRTSSTPCWDLSKNERGFELMYGLAMDDDPTANYTAWDDETSSYPFVEDDSYEGVEAFEEGYDPCGTSARQAKLVFGIDIFLEGGKA